MTKLSPSMMERFLACPPSAVYATMFERKSSFYADEGTAAHALLERCIKEHKPAFAFEGQTHKVDGVDFVWDSEMCAHIQDTLDHLEPWLSYPSVVKTEHRLPLSFLGANASGVVDLYIEHPVLGTLVADYKHGAGVAVSVEENPQIMAYAMPWAFLPNRSPEETITLAILQPRAGGFKEWTTTRKRLNEFLTDVAVAKLHMNDTQAFNPTVKGCQFCPAKGHCYALRTVAFDWMDGVKGAMMEGKFEMLESKYFADLLDKAELVQLWARSVKEAAKHALEIGQAIPGYVLEPGKQGHRQWISDAQAASVLHEILGADAFKPAEVISPTVAEKKLGKKGFKENNLDALVTRKEEEPALKKVKSTDAAQEFDAVDVAALGLGTAVVPDSDLI